MKWWCLVIVGSAALLPVSVNAQEHRWPTDEEQAQAAKPYEDCMHAEAERIDDGRTDIGVVGERVDAACNSQFDHMIEEIGRTLTPEERQSLREREEEMRRGFGTVAVGKVRVERQPTKP